MAADPYNLTLADVKHDVQSASQPIAIIGMGCRFPGQASSPSKLWNLLMRGESGHCPVPSSRYNAEGFYHPNAERPGSINSVGGYFLDEDVRTFENAFFGINNLEATYMDAQQRKLLEVVYESFENAGVPLDKICGSDTGVYVGNFTLDFMTMQYRDPEYFTRYSATGAGPTVLSNRITHCFDLHGPSLVLDTACSSSLYALHSACLGLEAGDCKAAIVASANLIQSPEQQLIAVKAGILSPESLCHTFDEQANGYGRAEGAASLYIKKLSDAIRDGDPVRAVIRATAVNGNGKTPGIVQPSIRGQEAVIRAAYRRAGLSTDETDYIEAHGTGTKIGDPIEVESISRVFHHRTGRPTLIGGIKPNLGHSEGCSGLASIIKVVLALEMGLIPATIGVGRINPDIKVDEWNVEIATTHRSWPQSRAMRASINSFGFGGANSHVILEAANAHLPQQESSVALRNGYPTSEQKHMHNELSILIFSNRTEHSLLRAVNNLAEYVTQSKDAINLKALAYTLDAGRPRLATRGYLLVSQTFLKHELMANKLTRRDLGFSAVLPFTFVYTGQGSHWAGMGSQLIKQFPSFRKSIRQLDTYLASLGNDISPSWSLEAMLLATPEVSTISTALISQPLCTAIQVALTDLLRSWNVMPKTVVGHSSGEIGAAYAAGFISAHQAILAAYTRGLTVSQYKLPGAMLAVGLEPIQAQLVIDEFRMQDKVKVACFNSPESCTLSGDSAAIDEIHLAFKDRKCLVKKLDTDGKAYHSDHMKCVGSSYQLMLKELWSTSGEATHKVQNGFAHTKKDRVVRMVSTVTGIDALPDQIGSPAYWRTNLESPVRFQDAVEKVLDCEQCHIIEIGPHSTLKLPIQQIAVKLGKDRDYYLYNATLFRDKDSVVTMLNLVGSLFLHAHDEISFGDISTHGEEPLSQKVKMLYDLPTYPWDYTSPTPWSEPRSVIEFRNRRYPRHDLLGSQIFGGSRRAVLWRNILNIDEIKWLAHHRLGPTIVFPAAAYIAMAIEAICQVSEVDPCECPGVEMRNLNFLRAMDFHPEQKPQLEVFTEMRLAQLSRITKSKHWWQFSVSSLASNGEQSIAHVNGLVRLTDGAKQSKTRQIQLRRAVMEQQAPRIWYDKFTQEGLCWGPLFAAMEEVFCDSDRQAHEASSTIQLLQGDENEPKGQPQYIVHPVSIDAMLQTAFVATTGGWVRNLRATVPVSMDFVQISAPGLLDFMSSKRWHIDSRSESVGFGTVKINAELYNTSGQVLIRMGDVRCIAYQGNMPNPNAEPRSPLARVAWKPDLKAFTMGANGNFSTCLDLSTQYLQCRTAGSKDITLRLASALELLVHRQPNLAILEVNGLEGMTTAFLDVLRGSSPLRCFSSYSKASISEEGQLRDIETILPTKKSNLHYPETGSCSERSFDVIICESAETALSLHPDWMAPSAIILTGRLPPNGASAVAHYTVLEETGRAPSSVSLLWAQGQPGVEEMLMPTQILLIKREGQMSELERSIKNELNAWCRQPISIISLSQASDVTIATKTVVVLTVEAQMPLLSTLTDLEMGYLQLITNKASKILWITNTNIMSGSSPEYALVLGLSRALMLEQPALQFGVFDVDDTTINVDKTAQNISRTLQQLVELADPDFEFAQKDGIVHISRWEPDDDLNVQFHLKQRDELVDTVLEATGRCELSIKHPGQMGTIYFTKKPYEVALPSEYVEIQVKSVGMNAKDVYVLGAKVDTKNASCSCECSGIVTSIGTNVTNIKVGDRVVAMAPGHFATYERFPQWAVYKLRSDESYTTTSTIPIVYSTALYGLKYRANLQPDESVLIHSAAGGVGIAAIQIAKHLGAKIFATVGTERKKAYLVETFGLDRERIFSSRDASFLPAILSATSGQGVDVVLNSLTGELLHKSFEACAEFGRFVEIGKRDIIDHGHLDMSAFGRSVSFMAFDLSNLYLSENPTHHELWQRLLCESMELVRSETVTVCSPLEVFDVSEITQAFRHFALGTRMGKVAVSFENSKSFIRVTPSRYETTFDSRKTYLLVGCLGGLGRSLSKWMMARGARNFIFLGRSGLDKPLARDLVEKMRLRSAAVKVVKGDVGDYNDVEAAIQAASSPVGGVVQAAMGLSEALWDTMSIKDWHTSLRPKVRGTWNLHNALRKEGRDRHLDFFLLTSSISGTVGTATESNYCASNAFLDSFARYRNTLGLPAISVGLGMISEVGYLHEHPEIEALMKRKGIHAINEDELLQIVDLALAHQHPKTWRPRYDRLASSHLLTGIEFHGLKNQRDRGFEGDNHVLADPRASLFAAAFARSTVAAGDGCATAATRHSLPEKVAEALRKDGGKSVLDAVRSIVTKKISNLILLPVKELQPEQKLDDFGLDSMLAAEFRTFIFRTLAVDVPFMTLLGKGTTVESLAGLIAEGLKGGSTASRDEDDRVQVTRRGENRCNQNPRSAKKVVGLSLPQSSGAQLSPPAVTTNRAVKNSSLCSMMSQTDQNAVCIGFLDNAWQHNLYFRNRRKLDRLTPVTFHQTFGFGISTKEKYKLALTLANTILELAATPWLKESLGNRDIHFHPEGSNVLGEPYIKRSFNLNADQPPRAISQSRAWVRNEAIFGLGVLLIELSYGNPLLTYITIDDLVDGNETIFTEYSVATRLTEGISISEPEKYTNAVMRCVVLHVQYSPGHGKWRVARRIPWRRCPTTAKNGAMFFRRYCNMLDSAITLSMALFVYPIDEFASLSCRNHRM